MVSQRITKEESNQCHYKGSSLRPTPSYFKMRRFHLSLFQLQLLTATISYIPSVMANSLISSKTTLSASQQASLAELIHLTMDPTEHETTHWRDMSERACINEIVKNVDNHFTLLASESVVMSLWSTDDGVSEETLSSLSSALKESLNQNMGEIDQCTPINEHCLSQLDTSSCDHTWSGWPRDKQQMIARQAANALLRACREGKSAKFKVTESDADQLLRLMTPLMLEAHSHIVLISFLLLATAGLILCVDTLAHKLLGEHATFQTSEVSQVYNECSCAICSGKLERGLSIGEGGFGEVYLCKQVSSSVGSSGDKVVKMIKADFERDVTVLQDALDEAKHLLSLKHRNVVRYYDVFVHRDVEGMRLRDARRRQLESNSRNKKKEKEKMWGWDIRKKESSHNSSEVSTEISNDAQYDYVCIVMEYCAGGTLLEHVASGVLLPLDVVVNTFLQVISALNHVHSKGIVHFDVKLENVFISREQVSSNVNTHPKRRRRKKTISPVKEIISSQETPRTSYTIKVGDFGLAARHQNTTPRPSFSTTKPSISRSNNNETTLIPPPLELKSIGVGSLLQPLKDNDDGINPSLMSGSSPLSLPRLEMKRRTTTKAKPKVNISDSDESDSEESDVELNHSDSFESSEESEGSEFNDSVEPSRKQEYPAGQGCVGGTAPYQSPEVFRDDTVSSQLGPEVDVWALGCALYESVTCQSLPLEPPYIGQLAMEPETWEGAWKNLSKQFKENIDIMVTCALGEGNSYKKKRASLKDKRMISTPLPSGISQSPGRGNKNKQPKSSHIDNKSNKRGVVSNNMKAALNMESSVLSLENGSISSFRCDDEGVNDIIQAGEGLCLLLEKCLSPDPSQRPQLATLLSTNQHGGLKWLKAFQNIPLRFGHAFGKPKSKSGISKRDLAKMRSERTLR